MDNAQFKNGYWIWDDQEKGLNFISTGQDVRASQASSGPVQTKGLLKSAFEVKFRDTVDNLEKVRFRRRYQRRIKVGTERFITLQDIKDVVLFLANARDLNAKFIQFFHTETMDRFLRALLVYFQFFLQIWNRMLDRREEAKRKIPYPGAEEIEAIISDDLADLRALVAREYSCILTGSQEMINFHHMGKMHYGSLTGKDRYLYEILFCVATRVIWVGMYRKHLNLIELELNRLFRSRLFNIIERLESSNVKLEMSKEEATILEGKNCIIEGKLYQRSPFAQELVIGSHDYRLLGIGVKHFEPQSKRLRYLEVAISAPVEKLREYGISVGILGMPTKNFDALLSYRGRLSLEERMDFHLPRSDELTDDEIMEEFPTEEAEFSEPLEVQQARRKQCDVWVAHVTALATGKPFQELLSSRSVISIDPSVASMHM